MKQTRAQIRRKVLESMAGKRVTAALKKRPPCTYWRDGRWALLDPDLHNLGCPHQPQPDTTASPERKEG